MERLTYPLFLKFRISTISNDFVMKDSEKNVLAYARQKLLKLKSDVVIYNNQKKEQELYRIKADKYIAVNMPFTISNADGNAIGKVKRHGMRSIWKARYDIMTPGGDVEYTIKEKSVWTRFWDGLVGEIPIIGYFTGYFLNPTYIVRDDQGNDLYALRKRPSFFGRKFSLDKLNDMPSDSEKEDLIILSLFMMVLLERRRG